MKQAVPSAAGPTQKEAAEPARASRQQRAVAPGGPLAQLAAMVNASSRVQALVQLKDDIQHSSHMQSLMGVAAEINQGTPAQFRAGLERDPVQLEQGAAPPPNRTGLPDRLKSGVEGLSGVALDSVEVHYNSARPAQLNALAYAQGSDIHVAPGQEQHLPHEAWHVVQQAQGRVRPTMKSKNGVPVNDDQGLEHEADVMGVKALASIAQRKGKPEEDKLLQGKFAPALANAPVQRAIGENGYSLPADERDVDDFLEVNGFGRPLCCTAADYNTVVAMHAALLNQIGAADEVAVDSPEGLAYQALVDFAEGVELKADNPTWTATRDAAADNYEAAPGAGDLAAKNAAATGTWPGRGAMPGTFSTAVVNEIARCVAARAAAVNAAYDAYNDGRLLLGTIHAVRHGLGAGADLAAVSARLALVYQRQCTVTRQNWLLHLGIAGQPINGSADRHYTTFNNSVAAEADIAGLQVDTNNVDALCAELFTAHTPGGRQLHATIVAGAHRYHRYWDGTYGNSPGAPAISQGTLGNLNDEYARMVGDIRGLVTTAKNRHGRIAHNNNGQQVVVGP